MNAAIQEAAHQLAATLAPPNEAERQRLGELLRASLPPHTARAA